MPSWLLRSVVASLAAAITILCAGRIAGLAGISRGSMCRYFAPCTEEMAKSLYSALFGAPLVLSHVLFGLYECLWDCRDGSPSALRAGVASLACHAGFGVITALSSGIALEVCRVLGGPFHGGRGRFLPEPWGLTVGIAVAVVFHSAWNGITCGRPRSGS